jgi:hypothetical protein
MVPLLLVFFDRVLFSVNMTLAMMAAITMSKTTKKA